MDEMMMMEELMMKEAKIVLEACDEFLEKMEKNNVSEVMKQSAWCMLSDMLFKENSAEVSKRCIEYIEEVNNNLGTL